MKVTVLGCGPSSGVPTITGDWGKCNPKNPKNRRRRPSILLQKDNFTILIDTSPDLHQQLIDAKCDKIDAVLYTHEHADHVMGIDDLRGIHRSMRKDIDIYAAAEVLDSLKYRFGYLFKGIQNPKDLYRPIFNGKVIPSENWELGPFKIKTLVQDHGICTSLGFHFGQFAYSTDVVRLSNEVIKILKGVEYWIVDCLRDGREHPTHANLKQTLSWIKSVEPKFAYLTHMNFETDYDIMLKKLPPGIEPAYDNLVLDIV